MQCRIKLLSEAGFAMSDGGRKDLSLAARGALELRAGRALSDREWASAHTALLEFIRILRSWDRPGGPIDAVSGLPRAA